MYESLQQLDTLTINFNRTGNWLLVLFMAVVMYGVAASFGIGMLAGMVVIIPYIKSKRRATIISATTKRSCEGWARVRNFP